MIDFDAIPEDMLDQPIEPWQPKVGDRVRIRLNGECSLTAIHLWVKDDNGRIGIIEDRYAPAIVSDHPYYVAFCDAPRNHSSFAACELEPA